MLPHSAGIYPQLTARENIAYFGALHGLIGPALDRRVDELIAELDIGDCARSPREGLLAGPAHQGRARARARARSRGTCCSTSRRNGLDVMATRALRALILALRAAGHCVLFSSHVMQEVAALCDDIVIIDHGRVVAAGTPAHAAQASSARDARGRLRRRDRRRQGPRMKPIAVIVMLKELRESLRDRRTLLTSLVLGPIFAPLFFILILKLDARALGRDAGRGDAGHDRECRRRAESRAAAARERARRSR